MIAVVVAIVCFFIGVGISGYISGHVAYEEGVKDERTGWYIHAKIYNWKKEDFKRSDEYYRRKAEAKWGKNQAKAEIQAQSMALAHGCPKEEPVSEDLEEAAFDYAEACKYDGGEKLLSVEHFKAGANWQKDQMMAKGIEGTVRPDDNEIWCNLSTFNFKDGDKCKVVLIKED